MTSKQKQDMLTIALLMRKGREQEEAKKKAQAEQLRQAERNPEPIQREPFLSNWVEPLEEGTRPWDSVTGEPMDDATYAEYLKRREK